MEIRAPRGTPCSTKRPGGPDGGGGGRTIAVRLVSTAATPPAESRCVAVSRAIVVSAAFAVVSAGGVVLWADIKPLFYAYNPPPPKTAPTITSPTTSAEGTDARAGSRAS